MKLHEKLAVYAQIDSFRIVEQVSHGGMASVFKAVDTRNGRPVALKVPHPEFEADAVWYERFERECEIGQRLNHPAVMRVYGSGPRTHTYMVMEWCEGRLLRTILDEGRMDEARSVALAVKILRALAYIHAQGVVHRDLKPENIMVHEAAGDAVKLIDFGIAGDAEARRLTYANFTPTLGTPNYIAPEQLKGKRGDARTDIYAVGILLYEMLTGKLPFYGMNPLAAMNDRLLNYPVPPTLLNPKVSVELQEVLYRALERNPTHRYARAQEFSQDLENLDRVGVADRVEMREWQQRKSSKNHRILYFCVLVLVPVCLLVLLLLSAPKRP